MADEFKQESFEDMIDDSQATVTPQATEKAGGETAIVSYTPQLGTAEFDDEDIAWPRLRLAQGLSDEVQQGNARPGQWTVLGQKARDRIVIIPLGYKKRRELTDDEFNRMCSSEDGVNGIGEPGGECLTCPMNQWSGPKGSRRPPACHLIYSYVIYDVEGDTMARLEFKKTALSAGRLLNTMVAQRGVGKVAVALSSKAAQSPRGNFYIPQITPVEYTEDMQQAVETLLGNG